jgi:hypothetical protein
MELVDLEILAGSPPHPPIWSSEKLADRWMLGGWAFFVAPRRPLLATHLFLVLFFQHEDVQGYQVTTITLPTGFVLRRSELRG